MPAQRRRHRGTMRFLDAELRAAVDHIRPAAPAEATPMPSPPHRQSPYPGKTHRLKDAAALNQLVIVRCAHCRRSVTYLATDLVDLFNPERDALLPPFGCSKCGKSDYIDVKLDSPASGDWGALPIRRPGPIRLTQTWRSCKLGDP